MAKIDGSGAKFLKEVILEAGSRGDFFIQQRDYARLMGSMDELQYKGDSDSLLDVDDTIWSDALRLAKQYKIKIPSGCKDDSAITTQDDDAAIGQGAIAGAKPKNWSPNPFTKDDPAFTIEGWEGLDIKEGKVFEAMTMARHFLILGETGSGKTASGVMPLLRSILGYESLNAERAAILVIDPKFELRHVVNEVMGGRFEKEAIELDLDKDQYRIDIFEQYREETHQAGPSARDVVESVKSFSEDLYNEAKLTHDAYWINTPLAMIRDVLEVLLYCHRKKGSDFWAEFTKLVLSNSKGAEKDSPERAFAELIKKHDISYDPDDYFKPMKQFFDLLGSWSWICWPAFDATCKQLNVPPHISAFTNKFKDTSNQLNATLVGIATRYLADLTSPNLVRHVSLNPIEAPKNSLRIEDAANDGKVLIYYPGDNSFVSDAIGRLIKSKFFVATFTRKNKERPIAYVCDEFQRFITGDPESGEQSFLDRCRAYRGICVLATQSIASIQKALYDAGEQIQGCVDACISIILNNTGTKLFFRNTDKDTQERLKQLIPINTLANSGHHIMDARPISTLKVGECYFLLSDSKWGRAQISLMGQTRPAPKPLADNFGSAYRSTHKIMGDVTAESIVKLCDEIDSAVCYYQYRYIKIEICSPGGEVLALQHYLSRLAEWRKLGVTIETVALMSVASAAAIILSLGDVGHRSAYPVARLLYHNGMARPSSFGTKEDFAQVANELQRIDSHLQARLVKHICGNDNDSVPKFINLLALRKRKSNGKKMNHYMPTLDGPNDSDLRNPSRRQYETVLKELFEKNMFIDPEDAKLLGLIDCVLD